MLIDSQVLLDRLTELRKRHEGSPMGDLGAGPNAAVFRIGCYEGITQVMETLSLMCAVPAPSDPDYVARYDWPEQERRERMGIPYTTVRAS